MRFVIFTGIIYALSAMQARAEVGVHALYGQTSDLWKKVETLSASDLGPSEINQLLEGSFQNPQEGIAHLEIYSMSPTHGSLNRLFSHGGFGLRADTLVGGEIRNRILPDVRAYSVRTAAAEFVLYERTGFEFSGWSYQLGSTLGIGQQKLAEASAFEFYPTSPIRESVLFYSGLDLGIGYQQHFENDMRSRSFLTIQPTFFHSNFSDSQYQFKIADEMTTLRWKFMTEWIASLNNPLEAGVEASLHTIAGPQPIPVRVLPRTWDSIHDLKPFPVIGASIGAGSTLRAYTRERKFTIELTGGFYGGYFGAGAEARIHKFSLAAGTWGIEQTSGFRVSQSRIEYLSLEFHYEL